MIRMSKIRVALLGLALAAPPGVASAFWTGSGEGGGSAGLATLSAPTITGVTAGAEAVELSWSAVSAPGAGSVEYYVARDGGSPSGCPTSSAPSTATSCTDTKVPIGSHKYMVTAVFRSWTAASTETTATVSYGPATHFVLEAAATSVTPGQADNLTITAKDAFGNTVTSYTGTHSLTFEGASESPNGTKPAVVNEAGVAKSFGEATEISFAAGKAIVATGKNGVMKLYKAESASIVVKEGSLSSSPALVVTVGVGGTKKLALSAPAEVTAGNPFSVTLTATDEYGNTTTSYAGSKTIAWSGPGNSPSGHAPEYPSTATTVTFTSGVGTASGIVLYGAVASVTLTAKEGSSPKGSTSIKVVAAAAKVLNFNAIAEQTAGSAFNATLTAKDEYGNTATSYAGAKTLTWSGPASSPSGHAPEYPSTATTVTFTSGVGKPTSLKLFDALATTLTVKEGSIEGMSSSFNVKASAFKRIAWSEPKTEPANKITSSLCLFECTAEGLGSEGKFAFKVATTDEWGNLQASHGSGSKTIKLSTTCASCSVSTATLTIAEGVASSAEATFTGASNLTWSGTLEATEGALKATATLKH
jgi:hypothetical protein